MNDLKVFENTQFGQIRTMNRNGEPWFVLVDVCRVLELKNRQDALSRLDEDEHALVSTDVSKGRSESLNCVNEPGLYSLVLGSRKPEARAFKRWIAHEVIPAIRQTGRYHARSIATRELTSDDYLLAAKMLTNCNPRTIDAVYSLLRDAGFQLPTLREIQPKITGKCPSRDDVSALLRDVMDRDGYTGNDISRMIGYTPMSVSRWTRGLYRPCSRYIQMIFEVFGDGSERGERDDNR